MSYPSLTGGGLVQEAGTRPPWDKAKKGLMQGRPNTVRVSSMLCLSRCRLARRIGTHSPGAGVLCVTDTLCIIQAGPEPVNKPPAVVRCPHITTHCLASGGIYCTNRAQKVPLLGVYNLGPTGAMKTNSQQWGVVLWAK